MESKLVFYAGIDVPTLELLTQNNNFKVVGVAHIDNLFLFTINPFNYLFLSAYKLHFKNKLPILKIIFFNLWLFFRYFGTSLYRRYTPFLGILIKGDIPIFDLESEIDVELIRNNKPDLMVINAWSMIPDTIISCFKIGIINIHPSKLPQYRGALPTLWTLKNKDTETAVTYMLIDSGTDTGNIISQHTISVSLNDTWLTLENKIRAEIAKSFTSDVVAFLRNEIHPYPQNKTNSSSTAKYEPYREILSKRESSDEILNKIGLYPWLDPGTYAYMYINEMKVYLYRGKKAVVATKNPFIFQIHTADSSYVNSRLFIDIPITSSIILLSIQALGLITTVQKNN